jgi:biopolymer transport protein ExbD
MKLRRQRKDLSEFTLSAMTDIIFLLLVFFMLTSTLVMPNALNLKLPSSNSKTTAPNALIISIDKTGQFYINDNKPTTPEDIEQLVQARIAKETDPKNVTITILADKSSPIEYVVNIMNIAYRTGVNAILSTEPSK